MGANIIIITQEEKTAIAKYACKHGVAKAVRHFKEKYVKESCLFGRNVSIFGNEYSNGVVNFLELHMVNKSNARAFMVPVLYCTILT